MWLGLALVLGQPATLISVETGYGTVGSALAQVSAASGVSLRAEGEVAREELLLAVSDVRLEDLRVRIAEATDASWTEADGVWTLVRTAETVAHERSRAVAQRVSGLEKVVGTLEGAYEPLSDGELNTLVATYERARSGRDGSVDNAVWAAIQDQQPLSRFGRALPRILGAQELAKSPLNSRQVFTLRPTRLQEAFPRGLREAHAAFLRDADRLSARIPVELSSNSLLVRRGRGQEFAIEVVRSMNGMEISLLLDNGDVSAEPRRQIEKVRIFNSIPWGEDSATILPELTEPMPLQFDRSLRETIWGMLQESGASSLAARTRMREWIISAGGEPGRVILPVAIRAMASGGRDVVWNPMSIAYFPVLMIYAESTMGAASQPALTAESADLRPLFSYPKEWAGDWTLDESWILGRPASRDDDRILRADPRALVRLLETDGVLSLRDVARFAVGSESASPDNENLLTAVFLAEIPELAGLVRPETWPLLQLLGSLSDAEWTTLKERGQLPLLTVTGAQRRMLERTLYADLIGQGWPVNERGEFRRVFSGARQVEPTSYFASGLPSSIVIRTSQGDNALLEVGTRNESGQEVRRPADLATVAYWIVMRERGFFEGIPEILWFSLSSHRFESVGVVFDGQWTRVASLDSFQSRTEPEFQRMRREQLPADMRERLESYLREYREMDLPPPGRDRGGVAPP